MDKIEKGFKLKLKIARPRVVWAEFVAHGSVELIRGIFPGFSHFPPSSNPAFPNSSLNHA